MLPPGQRLDVYDLMERCGARQAGQLVVELNDLIRVGLVERNGNLYQRRIAGVDVTKLCEQPRSFPIGIRSLLPDHVRAMLADFERPSCDAFVVVIGRHVPSYFMVKHFRANTIQYVASELRAISFVRPLLMGGYLTRVAKDQVASYWVSSSMS